MDFSRARLGGCATGLSMLLAASMSGPCRADDLAEPPVFASQNGVLDT
ncbi:hypothetical protein [Roseateles saccharophilus]|nr:hypothetical protein [Roseateles saccharophilus]